MSRYLSLLGCIIVVCVFVSLSVAIIEYCNFNKAVVVAHLLGSLFCFAHAVSHWCVRVGCGRPHFLLTLSEKHFRP
jgi:hypothetical protein